MTAIQTKLYGVRFSPFARKVFIALELKHIEYEYVRTIPHEKSEPFQSISPCGKIPAFEDDQIALPDSVAICAYLEARYPNPSIYPKNPTDYAKAIWLEQFANNELSAVINPKLLWVKLVGPLFFNEHTDDRVAQQAMAVDLPPLLSYLESQLTSAQYFIADGFSIADISIGCALLGINHAGFCIDKITFPKLAAYMQRFLQHPIVAKLWQEELAVIDYVKEHGVS